MNIGTVATYALLLIIASVFYTRSDNLAIYGFGILGLITVGLVVIFGINYEAIVAGYNKSEFGNWLKNIPYAGTAFWATIAVFFMLALKMIIQVCIQLGRRAQKTGSTDLQLSNASMRILQLFRNSYYVFIFAVPLLVLSFYASEYLKSYGNFVKWIQLALFATSVIVFIIFADLFAKGEFVKIKNDSTKTVITPNLESNKERNQRIGETSVIVR